MPSPSFLEMRSRNAIHILQAVRESPGMSRAELAKVCDLAKSTVSSIVDQLTEATILTESGPKPSISGRRAVGLVFNPKCRFSIGISIDNDRIECALSDLDGKLAATRRKRLQQNLDADSLASTVCHEVGKMLATKSINATGFVGLGIAAPGPISPGRQATLNGNPIHLESLAKYLLEKLSLNCRLGFDSNTNMAAIAECHRSSAGLGEVTLVVRLGSEVRAAVMKDRELLRGKEGLAGNIGHIVCPDNTRDCYCGRRGCINAVAGINSIVTICRALGAPVQHIDDVIAAAKHGDNRCITALANAATAIGYGIACAVNILAPSELIVTGKLVESGQHVQNPLETALKLYSLSSNHCDIHWNSQAQYSEAVGASLLPLQDNTFLAALVSNSEIGQPQGDTHAAS